MIAFDAFFSAIHGGRSPYPWQSEFAASAANGKPPALIRIPTGCGKTATIDALIWALASQAERPAVERTVGTRIVWAIDRRILVDEVHAHASSLAEVLAAARTDPTSPLHQPARALASISGGEPLVATRWRGGVDFDRKAVAPDQPQIITSTVGQIGSRMLFRGYGVGRGSLALEAGLAACDVTICLDEAHLAEPFAQTVRSIRDRRLGSDVNFELPPLDVITLTATPSNRAGDELALSSQDESVLRTRLTGPKWVTLDDAPASDPEMTAALAAHSISHVEKGAVSVACIVNTVKRARAVFDRLQRDATKRDFDVILLMGPQRPIDRADALQKATPLFDGGDQERPIICVATQTFEVGLDADVDAMVSESASATALTQRLGRLNRSGERVGHATIVRDKRTWLYEDDEPLAWAWLLSRAAQDGTIDASVASLAGEPAAPPSTHPDWAPDLTDSVVYLLAQSDPRPGPFQDPDIETFLRGAESDIDADVTVCWRADLHPSRTGDRSRAYRAAILELFPPGRDEQLTISVKAAQGLLRAQTQADPRTARTGTNQALLESDVESSAAPAGNQTDEAPALAPVPFVVIRGDDMLEGSVGPRPKGLEAVNAGTLRISELAPGDAVVIPAELGGVDGNGLAPRSSGGPELDVASDIRPSEAPTGQRHRPRAVRISRAALSAWASARGEEVGDALWKAVVERLPGCVAGTVPPQSKAQLSALVSSLSELLPDHSGLAVLRNESARENVRLTLRSAGSPTAGNDEIGPMAPDGAMVLSATAGQHELIDRTDAAPPPSLEAHAGSVEERVARYGESLGFSETVKGSLRLAALAHDLGKADPRIQSFYRRGTPVLGRRLIAKSEFGTRDRTTARAAARLAGLPSRLRHEIASAAILAKAILGGSCPIAVFDPELALHLVATHHGRGRPVPVMPSGGHPPRAFHVDLVGISGSAMGDGIENWIDGKPLKRFWDVLERYGPWGAAYLEAVLMLADRTSSAEGL